MDTSLKKKKKRYKNPKQMKEKKVIKKNYNVIMTMLSLLSLESCRM